MSRKVLPILIMLAVPLWTLSAQEGPSVEDDLRTMAGLYTNGQYDEVRDFKDVMKVHFTEGNAVDPFFRDLALFLLWASRIELGEKDAVKDEMAYYFNTEGQTEFHSLPPLMSAFLYHDLLAETGDQDATAALSGSILGIPDYANTIRIWADAGDHYNIVRFSSDPFLGSLEKRYNRLAELRTKGSPVDSTDSWIASDTDPQDTETVFDDSTETTPQGVLATGGNFFIRRENLWFKVYWSHPFATERQAGDTGRVLVRDGVITEFLVKKDSRSGKFLLQIGALKSEKIALDWEKRLEGMTGGTR